MAINIEGDDWEAQLEKLFNEVAPHGRTLRSNHLTMYNSVWYAPILHNRVGFFVFSPPKWQEIVYKEYRAWINLGIPLNPRNAELAGLRAATRYRSWLRTKTSEMAPPVKKSEGPRGAYPGHWADRDAILQKGYWFEFDQRTPADETTPRGGTQPQSAKTQAAQAKADADDKKPDSTQ